MSRNLASPCVLRMRTAVSVRLGTTSGSASGGARSRDAFCMIVTALVLASFSDAYLAPPESVTPLNDACTSMSAASDSATDLSSVNFCWRLFLVVVVVVGGSF